MTLLNFLFYGVAGIAVIALPFLLVNWTRYLRRRTSKTFGERPVPYGFPLKSTFVFVAAIALAITMAEIISARSRVEALNFIQGLSGNYLVYVNQHPISDSARVISALKQISPEPAHHSHPTVTIRIEIHADNGDMNLELRRDSDNRQEYWVFYPKYKVTSNNEIGRITTTLFDGY